jgi:hypothetical protein
MSTVSLVADPYLLRGRTFGLNLSFLAAVRKSATPPFSEDVFTCRIDQVGLR